MKIKLYASAFLCAFSAAAQITPTASATAPPQQLFPVSTSPSNGDLNPYGVSFVPLGVPTSTVMTPTVFNPGDVLVSNFNNGQNAAGTGNLQGLGTTIIRIQSTGLTSTFFPQAPVATLPIGSPASLQAQAGVGLTNALAILGNGMVIVGAMPTTDGTSATAKPGYLLFITRSGTPALITYTANNTTLNQTQNGFVNNAFFALNGQTPDIIDGPWGMAVNDQGNAAQIFVSNVLTGTITRFHVTLDSDGMGVNFDQAPFVLVQGINKRPDPAALELGPSGLAYDPLPNSPTLDTLFISNSADNAVTMLPGAGWNTTTIDVRKTPLGVLSNDPTKLHGPLGLALAPNGNIYVANSDGNNADPNQPSEIEIFDMNGNFQGQFSVDPQNGGAFGIAFQQLGTINRPARSGSVNIATPIFRFAAVNDNFAPGNPLSLFKTPVLNAWTLFFN
jgi:hypothetical protein